MTIEQCLQFLWQQELNESWSMKKEMISQFDKRKSNIAKGLAILILLVHHIFYNYVYGEFPEMLFFFPECTYYLAKYGAFVIFVFATISGYGIAAYMNKNDQNVFKSIAQREMGLLEMYIPVYIVAVILCYFFNGNGLFLFETYGLEKRTFLIGMLFDMLGLSTLFSMPTLNSTWWYMGAAHCIIVFVPIFQKLAFVIKSHGAILLALVIYAGRYQNSTGTALRACILAAFIGACMYEWKLVEKISDFFERSKFGRIVELFILILSAYLVIQVKEANVFNGYYLWSITVPFMLIIVNDFASKIKGLCFLLEKLGTYSGMIYMLHSFVVSRIPRLSGIVYSMNYAWQAYLFVLMFTIGICVVLKVCLKWMRYDELVYRLKMKVIR